MSETQKWAVVCVIFVVAIVIFSVRMAGIF